MKQYRLGLIGAGNMAYAIAKAAIAAKVLDPMQIIASDPSAERLALFDQLGIDTSADNKTVIKFCEQIMLAVKPQMAQQPTQEIGAYGAQNPVVISIMAGLSTSKLSTWVMQGREDSGVLNESSEPIAEPRIIRVMPNTPVMIGQGMAGISLGQGAQPGDEQLSIDLFSAGGKAIVVKEAQLDAVTAVSGSGPAYVFYLARAMQQAAEELGLGEHSELLTSQTLLGAAQLLSESEESAATLQQRVTSPGGTTQAAIKTMDQHKVLEAVVRAIQAASDRSKELGKDG